MGKIGQKWQCVTPEIRKQRHCGFLLTISFWSLTLGKAEDIHLILWRGDITSNWMKPSAKSQQWTETFCQLPCEGDITEANPLILVKLADDYSPSKCLNYNLIGDPEPEPPSYAAPEFLTHRNCGMIHICWDNKCKLQHSTRWLV